MSICFVLHFTGIALRSSIRCVIRLKEQVSLSRWIKYENKTIEPAKAVLNEEWKERRKEGNV